jgi:hypothetical protein
MKFISILFFASILITLQSCGKDKLSSTTPASSSSPIYSGSTSCKMLNGGNLGGCCSSHDGAKNCGTGLYQFTSTNNLICNDGTVSPSCMGSN